MLLCGFIFSSASVPDTGEVIEGDFICGENRPVLAVRKRAREMKRKPT